MDGKMTFVYMPVRDMKKALAFYRDQLGLDEAWREGDGTVVFHLPGSETELMLDLDGAGITPGPMFIVPSVDEYYATQQGTIDFIAPPKDIPPGRMVTARDPFGNMVYFVDMTKTG